jgi:predicted aspartyl protease
VPEAFTTTVTRVSAPVDAYVIARLNSAGSGIKEYVDPATSRVVRRDAIAPTQTTVTLYDDFRTVAGYTSAWHWTERDGHPENDADYQVEALQARPVTTAEIEIPKPRRALVEFPAGKTIVDLPAKVINNEFIVRVTIAGRGLDFILDSGAAGITLETDVAKELGLTAVARASNAVNAGRYTQTEVVVPEMRVGELLMHDVAVATLPRLAAEDTHMRVVGLLGFDFIAELGLKLDYEQGRVTAYALNGPFPKRACSHSIFDSASKYPRRRSRSTARRANTSSSIRATRRAYSSSITSRGAFRAR